MKSYYLPKTDMGILLWLMNFAAKLSGYAPKYGLAAAEVTDVQASLDFYAYWFEAMNQYKEFKKKVVSFKDELRDGVETGGTPSVVPAPPTLGTMPPAVAPGIIDRATSMGNRIKSHHDYTEADGIDLGLEGAEIIPPDLVNAKPVLLSELIAGQPEIKWKKLVFDAVEIHVSRGSGQPFEFLAFNTSNSLTDSAALPPAGQSAVWKYKVIYIFKNQRVGQWSDDLAVTVMG